MSKFLAIYTNYSIVEIKATSKIPPDGILGKRELIYHHIGSDTEINELKSLIFNKLVDNGICSKIMKSFVNTSTLVIIDNNEFKRFVKEFLYDGDTQTYEEFLTNNNYIEQTYEEEEEELTYYDDDNDSPYVDSYYDHDEYNNNDVINSSNNSDSYLSPSSE